MCWFSSKRRDSTGMSSLKRGLLWFLMIYKRDYKWALMVHLIQSVLNGTSSNMLEPSSIRLMYLWEYILPAAVMLCGMKTMIVSKRSNVPLFCWTKFLNSVSKFYSGASTLSSHTCCLLQGSNVDVCASFAWIVQLCGAKWEINVIFVCFFITYDYFFRLKGIGDLLNKWLLLYSYNLCL